MSQHQAPDGMIPVEEFAKSKGLSVDRAIAMIRDGLYAGQVVGEQWYAREDQIDGAATSGAAQDVSGRGGGETPVLAVVFYLLSGLSLLGGFILASEFWPGESEDGYEWKKVEYVWSIIWATAAIVEAAVFAAIGKALSLLQKITENTAK